MLFCILSFYPKLDESSVEGSSERWSRKCKFSNKNGSGAKIIDKKRRI